MPTFDVLDNVTHANLKVKFKFGEEFRNNVNHSPVFPTEFQALQREYPIYFRQTEDKKYYAVVLLGLDKDENLFLNDDQWQARYIPALQMRGPFVLELREQDANSPESGDPLVRIDIDDSRVNEEEGESLFLPQGGHTPFFQDMLQALRRVHVGAQVSDSFFSYLDQFGLIEPITVQANYGDTLQYTIPDMFTISQERMAALSGDDLQKLNELGLLEHCYSVIFSGANMSRLVDMKMLKIGNKV